MRFCSHRNSNFFLLKIICFSIPNDPDLYPFLDYPIYPGARYEGVNINQYFLIGILEDGTEVTITSNDLNSSHDNFLRNILPQIEKQNLKLIENYVKIYEQKSSFNLVRLRLENHPLVITREGVNSTEKEVVVDLKL
ncbi:MULTISPECIES: hypothetical protein [Planktothrix]|nr:MULTISPECIES: hypothetical protein [Planktothrix]